MYTRKIITIIFLFLCFNISSIYADDLLDGRIAKPPIHFLPPSQMHPFTSPSGLSPTTVRSIYQLPTTGGVGTIAIIDAYDNPNIESDFNVFCTQYGLPTATASNFEIHKMNSSITTDPTNTWELEARLDVEWAHAIAPSAKILLVEATTNFTSDLVSAVNYARNRSDVVAISMSWVISEFAGVTSLNTTLTSPYGAVFFAGSGDFGTGVNWPAVSPNVVAVGGTSLSFDTLGNFSAESAWVGSGGGLSQYVLEPTYQTSFGVPSTQGFRAVPDVSYNADQTSGFSVYDTWGFPGWMVVGGTSAGTPQWAAIHSLDTIVNNTFLYQKAFTPSTYTTNFRDITAGSNAVTTATYYTKATVGYDYVTGLGSPLFTNLITKITNVDQWKDLDFDSIINSKKEELFLSPSFR